MANATATLLPRTVHLNCLWHVMEKDKSTCFFRLIYAAAFATSDDVSTFRCISTRLGDRETVHDALLFSHSADLLCPRST